VAVGVMRIVLAFQLKELPNRLNEDEAQPGTPASYNGEQSPAEQVGTTR